MGRSARAAKQHSSPLRSPPPSLPHTLRYPPETSPDGRPDARFAHRGIRPGGDASRVGGRGTTNNTCKNRLQAVFIAACAAQLACLPAVDAHNAVCKIGDRPLDRAAPYYSTDLAKTS